MDLVEFLQAAAVSKHMGEIDICSHRASDGASTSITASSPEADEHYRSAIRYGCSNPAPLAFKSHTLFIHC